MALHHDQPPERGVELSAEMLRKLAAMQQSPYFEYVKSLRPVVEGREVVKAEVGSSGFALYLSDGRSVVCALQDQQWRWQMGTHEISEVERLLMNSPDYGNASVPLRENLPYAQESCDLGAEVRKAVGQRITGLSIGERCFNFCFEDSRELDVTLRRDPAGKLAYRVFWEQW